MHRIRQQAQLYQDCQQNTYPTADASLPDRAQTQLFPDFHELIQDDSFLRLQVQSQLQFDYLNESSHRFQGCPYLHDDPLDSDQHQFNQAIDASQAPFRPNQAQDPPNASNSNLQKSPSDMSTLQQKSNGPQIIPIHHQLHHEYPQSSEHSDQAGEGSSVGLKIDLDNIFEQRPLQRTRNITKAIRKYIDRHLGKYQDHFKGHKDFFKKMKKQLKESKDKYFSLDNMARIFTGGVVPEGLRNLPRLVICKILNRWLRKSIIPNNQVKDKLTYLVATKVYSLRCRNEQLCSRVQMR